MGQQLTAFYEKAQEKAGVGGKVKLAMITRMAAGKAAEEPDSPENIKMFQEALAKI